MSIERFCCKLSRGREETASTRVGQWTKQWTAWWLKSRPPVMSICRGPLHFPVVSFKRSVSVLFWSCLLCSGPVCSVLVLKRRWLWFFFLRDGEKKKIWNRTGPRAESTDKGISQRSKYVIQVQQQRPESPMVHKVHIWLTPLCVKSWKRRRRRKTKAAWNTRPLSVLFKYVGPVILQDYSF